MIKKKFTRLSLIPTHIYLPLIVAFLWNQIVYCGSRMLMKNHFHYDLTTTMDSFIPVIPWTLAIYVFSFIYWPCQYILCCQMKKEHAYHFLSADFFAKTVCLIFFLFFPTTNIRPQISEHGIWNLSLNLLYRLDAPDNLFPSIHCLCGNPQTTATSAGLPIVRSLYGIGYMYLYSYHKTTCNP